jgi:hypothetical protein
MNPIEFENWKTGKWAEVEWKAFSSTSLEAGRSFATPETNDVFFIIRNRGKQGGFVAPVSSVGRGEMELLVGRSARYRVVGWSDQTYTTGVKVRHKTIIVDEVTNIPERQLPPKFYTKEECLKLIQDAESVQGTLN